MPARFTQAVKELSLYKNSKKPPAYLCRRLNLYMCYPVSTAISTGIWFCALGYIGSALIFFHQLIKYNNAHNHLKQ